MTTQSKLSRTSVGKFMNILRIQNDQSIRDMCNVLGMSSATLQGIETGTMALTNEYKQRVIKNYNLTEKQRAELEHLATLCCTTISITIPELSQNDLGLLKQFASALATLSDADKLSIAVLLRARNLESKSMKG